MRIIFNFRLFLSIYESIQCVVFRFRFSNFLGGVSIHHQYNTAFKLIHSFRVVVHTPVMEGVDSFSPLVVLLLLLMLQAILGLIGGSSLTYGHLWTPKILDRGAVIPILRRYEVAGVDTLEGKLLLAIVVYFGQIFGHAIKIPSLILISKILDLFDTTTLLLFPWTRSLLSVSSGYLRIP